jgi:TatA/E family protein of Tat protein translocase
MEMGIIAVVALLIFGPEKLPEMMGQAGKMVRDFRRMTAEMSGEFEKTIAEAKSVTKDLQGEVGSMSRQVSSVTKSVQSDLSGKKSTTSKSSSTAKRSTTSSAAKKTGSSSATSKSTTAKSTATAKSGSSTTSATTKTAAAAKPAPPQKATREDPTAAVSLFEPSAPKRERRARKATVSAFGDATPRTLPASDVPSIVSADGDSGAAAAAKPVDLNDPLVRARQRRRSAGYARTGS